MADDYPPDELERKRVMNAIEKLCDQVTKHGGNLVLCCNRCGHPMAKKERITIFYRTNGKVTRVEHYHRERCCPFAMYGRMPTQAIIEVRTVTEPPKPSR